MRPDDVPANTVRGQYRGYRDERGVRAGSTTATFAALRLYIDNWRWQGVPFCLRSGKCLASKMTEITVQFKDVPHRLFPKKKDGAPHANFLAFASSPTRVCQLRIEAKVRGWECTCARWR